jgi:hypothetical protein
LNFDCLRYSTHSAAFIIQPAIVESELARSVTEIIAEIAAFEPSEGSWLGLEALLQELFECGSAPLGIDAMLSVFERYPTEDGAGVSWSIVHGLESLPGYERKLVESIRRTPSEFGLVMVNRLLNTGCEDVEDVSLVSLLEQVAQDETAVQEIRQQAQNFVNRHKG